MGFCEGNPGCARLSLQDSVAFRKLPVATASGQGFIRFLKRWVQEPPRMLNSCAMQPVETTVGDRSRSYVIPAEAYGKARRGRGWLVLFAWYSCVMFSAELLFDMFFTNGHRPRTLNWMHDAFFSIFWGAGMTVFAASKTRLSGLDIRRNSVVLYEGEALDPVYRTGRVVRASEIQCVTEVGNTWFRRAGLIVRYHRDTGWFKTKQFYISSRAPDYPEIKEQLISLQRQC